MVVLAHPRMGSFCHALADAAGEALRERGLVVTRHDLYLEGFDPVVSARGVETAASTPGQALEVDADPLVVQHRRELAEAHTVVVVHPNWWGKPPAMMAGWMDRVLAPGVVYALDEAAGVPRSLLGLRRLVVLNTGDTDLDREAETFGDSLELIWRRCVGTYLGDVAVRRMLAGPMAASTVEQRATWLDDARRLTAGG